ncbi:hypothetical protein FJTKL_10838 [Diaporthe vaccinii]
MDFDSQYQLQSPAASINQRQQSLWAPVCPEALSPLAATACSFDCEIHTEAHHDALVLLNRRNQLPAQFIHGWQPTRTDEIMLWFVQQEHVPSSSSLVCADGQVHQPALPTRQDGEMLRIFVDFISRFKASLDGEPDPASNLYTKHYVPFCLHNPMLAQIAIYTAACFINETCPNVVDDTTAMTRKGDAICMLETHLRTMGSTTDEAIAGVMQLILNEWYWGGRKELEAHLGGLREMVRSRGGLANLGLSGLLAKLIIMTDITIALSLEIEPHLQEDLPFESPEATHVPFRVFLNTPLVSPLVPFKTCAEPLKLHDTTARILDDMRFLIGLVLSLPADCSQKDLQKLQTTSTWIYDRISGLPEEAEAVPQHRASEGLIIPSPSTTSAFGPPPPQSIRRASSAASPRVLPEHNHGPGFFYSREQQPSPRQRTVFQGSSMPDHHAARPPQPLQPEPEDAAAAAPTVPDVIYQAVRQAALVYARAIMLRRPLRDPRVCSAEDFVRLWTTVWRVPLRAWKALLGVFMWVVLCVTPASAGTPHERFVRNCLEVGLVQMGLESWEVAEKGMDGALRLVRWLACRDGRPVGQGT